MSGYMRFAMSPATPLSLTSLRQITSSSGEWTDRPTLHASLSCGVILLCDLSPPAARALFPAGTPSSFGRVPFRVLSQFHTKKINQ